MRKTIVGVMGPGTPKEQKVLDDAYKLGKLIAQKGGVLLTGGTAEGVMEEANKGSSENNGPTLGIIRNSKTKISEFVDIPVITDVNEARNNINVLSSDFVIACGTGLGTMSEIALALKNNKKVLLLNQVEESKSFLKIFNDSNLFFVETPEEAVDFIESKKDE